MAFGIMRTVSNFPAIPSSRGCITVFVTSSLSTYIKGLSRQVFLLNKEISLLAGTVTRRYRYCGDRHAFKTRRNKRKKSTIRKLGRSLSKLSRKIERMSDACASSRGKKHRKYDNSSLNKSSSCFCSLSSRSKSLDSSRSAAKYSQISSTTGEREENSSNFFSDDSCQCDKKPSKNKRYYNIEIKPSRNKICSISSSFSEKSSSSSY